MAQNPSKLKKLKETHQGKTVFHAQTRNRPLGNIQELTRHPIAAFGHR